MIQRERTTARLTVVAVALLSGALVGSAQPASPLTTDEVVARMMQAELSQQKNLLHYRAFRSYDLRNSDGSRAAGMLAQVDYYGPAGKTIKILDERGPEGMFRRALHRIAEAEVRTATSKDSGDDGRLIPANYLFRLSGTEMRDGRQCFVLTLTPKRKSRYLVEGRAWVDSQDYALLALEGRTSGSVSFWVGKPYIVQSYEKVGDFWLLARNHSIADAKLVGRIALTIETRDVEMGGTRIALSPHHRSTLALN